MSAATCLSRCWPRARPASRVTPRRAGGRSPTLRSGPRSIRSTSSTARTAWTATAPPGRGTAGHGVGMVGIVIVSHSAELAEGVVALARERAGAGLSLQAAGGIGEPGVLGTDADRVRAAIEEAMSPDGVLVLMDLGSALMSAEFAVELLADAAGPVRRDGAGRGAHEGGPDRQRRGRAG